MRVFTSIIPAVLSVALLPFPAYSMTGSTEAVDVASLYEQALMQFNKGEVADSVIHLKNVLQADPSFLAGHVLLGRSYLDQGYASLAEKEFNRAVRLGVDKALVVEYRAQALQLQLKFAQLLDEIRPANYSRQLNSLILVARGEAYFQLGRIEEAELEYTDAGKLDPTNTGALLGVATIRMTQNRFAESEMLIDQAAILEPTAPSVWYRKGALYHAQSRFEESAQFYSRALELNPDHHDSKMALAGVLMDRGDFVNAEIAMAGLYEQSPENPQVAYLLSTAIMQNGDQDRAVAVMKDAKLHLETLSDSVLDAYAPALLLAGLVHYDLGEHQKARSYLTRYIARFPQEARARIVLAKIYHQEQAVTQVIQTLEPALEASPNNYQVLLMLGEAYMRLNKHFKASQMFDQAAQFYPGDLNVLARQGVNELLRGRTEQGLSSLQSAQDQSPQAESAGFIRVTALLRQGQSEQALVAAQQLLEKSPGNPLVANLLASAEVEAGRLVAARNRYDAIVQRFPDFYPARINLAKLDFVEGKLDSAEQKLLALLEQQPENVLLMVELARVNFAREDIKTATQWLEKAHGLDSHSVLAGRLLVDLYLRGEQYEKALAVAWKLTEKHSDDVDVLLALGRSQIAAGKTEEARASLKKASYQTGTLSPQLPRIAALQQQTGDLDGAVYTLGKYLAASPKSIPARAQLIEYQLRKGLFAEAEAGIREIASAGSVALSQRLSGDLSIAQGNVTAAQQLYLQALQSRPETSTAARVFRTHLMLGQQGKALSFVEDWVTRFPGDDAMRTVLAEGYLNSNRLEEARRQFEALVAKGRAGATIYNNLAMIYSRQKDTRAEQFARTAYQLSPDSASVTDTLGWVLVQAGKSAEGLSLLRTAHARASDDPEIRYHIAVALTNLGRIDEARAELKLALQPGGRYLGKEDASRLNSELGTAIQQ